MDLRQIQYIVAIAEENNITRAAEKLYITQSALNQQLLKLEKELGVQLSSFADGLASYGSWGNLSEGCTGNAVA